MTASATDLAATVRDALLAANEDVYGAEGNKDSLAALAALLARCQEAERACPVCYSNDWDIDYDYNGEDEVEQRRCSHCWWPPVYPSSVEEHRSRYVRQRGLSPYIKDLEEGLAAAEAERDEAFSHEDGLMRERDNANDLRRIAEARVVELEQALGRATKIAEHLFGMVDKATWREHGAEWMGQYEGDHWAEQTWAEIKELAALQSGGSSDA